MESTNTTSNAETKVNGIEEIKGQDEEKIAKAEEFKTKGNDLLKAGKLNEALEMYSEAIYTFGTGKKSAIYYANRAFVNIKLENYGVAIMDGGKAIELDPSYVKGYYRRGSAYLALNHLEDAIKDFAKVCKLAPADKDAKLKLDLARKLKTSKDFAAAIHEEREKIAVNIQDIAVEQSYKGPRLDDDYSNITPKWCEELMEFLRDGKVLHKKYALMLLLKLREYFETKPSLIDVPIPDDKEFTVCGDIHGQYYDLLNIFKLNGSPSVDNPYLFNGDFVDRGSFSVEVIIVLMAWKVCLPEHFHMARGNHESKNMNKFYGFEGEVKSKYDMRTYELFSEVFCLLPLAHCLNKKVLVMHGGLFSKDGVSLDDLRKINRNKEPGDEGLMCETMWSDPCDTNGRFPSKRGVGLSFGPDVAKSFLEYNNLELLVRSHEVKDQGYEYQKEGRVLTVFSAPNYCDQMGNKGALVRFKGSDMKPKITTYSAVEHPKVPPMAYAQSSWNLF